MNPEQIMRVLQDKNRELSTKNDELVTLVNAAADAEREYNIAYATEVLKLRIDSHPVTIIPALAKGDPKVADLRFKSAVAEGVLDACRQRIKDIREAIGTARSLLTWMRAELSLTLNQES